VATAFAAPIGSYVGGIIGWRGVFWALVPIVLVNMIWQWRSLPAMPPQAANPVGKLFGLLKRRNVAFGMLGVMLTFAGAAVVGAGKRIRPVNLMWMEKVSDEQYLAKTSRP